MEIREAIKKLEDIACGVPPHPELVPQIELLKAELEKQARPPKTFSETLNESVDRTFWDAWNEVKKEWVPEMAEAIQDFDAAFNAVVDEKIQAFHKLGNPATQPLFIQALMETGHVIESGKKDPPYVWLLDDRLIPSLFSYLSDEKEEGWTLRRLCSLFFNSRREPMNYDSVKSMLSEDDGISPRLPDVTAEALEAAGYRRHPPKKRQR